MSNAYKYLNSRLGFVLEKMKNAYISGKRVFILHTDDYHFIRQIIDKESIIPIRGNTATSGVIRKSDSGNLFIEEDDNILCQKMKNNMTPSIYVCFINDSVDQRDMPAFPQKSMEFFVKNISGMTRLCNNDTERMNSNSIALIVSQNISKIPGFIVPYIQEIKVPFMAEMEFKEYVSFVINELDHVPTHTSPLGYELIEDDLFLTELFKSTKGMNPSQIKALLNYCKATLGHAYSPQMPSSPSNDESLFSIINKETEKISSHTPALTLIHTSDEEMEPSGMEEITRWLSDHKIYIKDENKCKEIENEVLKGILLTGVPGTGKSMMARYIARTLGLSLVRFDIGDVLGPYVGESEKKMNKALATIEALSPCVLFIDEMEKGFAGSQENSHETSRRLLGKFLTWMQEKNNQGISCFVFATANDISILPPEMFRSGRFDEKFYSFMPTAKQCEDIFKQIIIYQNKRYEKRNMGKRMFDEDDIISFFKDRILNYYCLSHEYLLKKQMIQIYDADNHLSANGKLFVGSDIAKLISDAKYEYEKEVSRKEKDTEMDLITKGRSQRDFFYGSELFKKCLVTVLNKMRTYGETNKGNIAFMYAGMVDNNFRNASNEVLLPFEGYDEQRYKTQVAHGNKDAKLYRLDSYDLRTNYDRQLATVISETVNNMADEIIQRKKDRRK